MTDEDGKQTQIAEYSQAVNEASDLLLLRKFDDCLDLCQKYISDAKIYPENPCAVQAVESLCLLAIQAYAELNRWQEVLTFVTGLYNGIEDCPQKVVQLCILLHAHVQDFTTCNAVAHIWLRNPRNHDMTEYSLIVELFIQYVLIAQNKIEDIPVFIEGCAGLKPHTKQALSHFVKNVESRKQAKAERDAKKTDVKTQKESADNAKPGLVQFVCSFAKRISSHIALINLTIVRNVLFVAIILYFIITRTNSGLPIQLRRFWNRFLETFRLSSDLPKK